MTTPSCSGACMRGYYCPPGATTQDANDCLGGAGSDSVAWFCPVSAGAPVAVNPGHYTQPESGPNAERNRHMEDLCTAGYYCKAGKRIKCGEGKTTISQWYVEENAREREREKRQNRDRD